MRRWAGRCSFRAGCSFNPRTRTGCDGNRCIWYGSNYVSTHAPARGATRKERKKNENIQSFNPRTRTGCDITQARREPIPAQVSTHAPARGATLPEGYTAQQVYDVSTHAPARGATEEYEQILGKVGFNPRTRTGCDIPPVPKGAPRCRFNPRTRTGCDRRPRDLSSLISSVSTHAPARGATLGWGRRWPGRGGFNPRTRTGCDASAPVQSRQQLQFQPTHPHGVRQRENKEELT